MQFLDDRGLKIYSTFMIIFVQEQTDKKLRFITLKNQYDARVC